MARAFREVERAAIQATLVAIAAEHFARFGYRKANVGEIARLAGIAKGTLYLFFASKSALFVAVAEAAEADVRARLLELLSEPQRSPLERVRVFLRFQFDAVREHPLLRVLMDPLEAAALIRDLEPGRLEQLAQSDDEFFAGVVEALQSEGTLGPVDPALFGGVARAIYAVEAQRALIGAAIYPAVRGLLIDALAAQLMAGARATS